MVKQGCDVTICSTNPCLAGNFLHRWHWLHLQSFTYFFSWSLVINGSGLLCLRLTLRDCSVILRFWKVIMKRIRFVAFCGVV